MAGAGATEAHTLIVTNVIRELSTQLKGQPCRTYSNDMRVQTGESGLYTYPDVVVVCGEPEFRDTRRDTLLNPTLVVEVLSKSTEAHDRGEKFAQYRRLPSLREYLLIAQDQPRLERFTRQADGGWLLSEATDLSDILPLPALGGALSLAEVYDRVTFDPAEANKFTHTDTSR